MSGDLILQRPVELVSFETRAAGLGLDPSNQSPIEVRLGYALLRLMSDPKQYGAPDYLNLFLPHGEVAAAREMPPITNIPEGAINVAPGCWVDRYQSDFLIDAKAPGRHRPARGTLECDGHFFHERTKDQASHDRKRDRDFQAKGILVLRFPGHEIFDNPEKCAREALEVLLRRSSNPKGEAA